MELDSLALGEDRSSFMRSAARSVTMIGSFFFSVLFGLVGSTSSSTEWAEAEKCLGE